MRHDAAGLVSRGLPVPHGGGRDPIQARSLLGVDRRMKAANNGRLSPLMRRAQHFTMGLHLARRFGAAIFTQRFSTDLLWQARVWGFTAKA